MTGLYDANSARADTADTFSTVWPPRVEYGSRAEPAHPVHHGSEET